MKEREKIVIGGLVTLLLLLWLGFILHSQPDFPGSGPGLLLGIAGAILMLVPLAYLFVKRIPRLKKWVTSKVSMRTLLAWHIYAGVLGPIFAILHTGHYFESPIGITLTAATLIVVISGFIGRYLMSSIGKEIRGKKEILAGLQEDYNEAISEIQSREGIAGFEQASPLHSLILRFSSSLFHHQSQRPEWKAIRLSDAIADVEYALRTHQTFKKAFSVWLKTHIALSLLLYGLLGVHIYSQLYFGLRWLN